MEKLPDELQQKILNYAMIRDTPFCIEECISVAEKSAKDSKRHGDDCADAALQLLLSKVEPTQVSHLLDWRIVNGTCRRFRNLGKEAFFSQKVFGMSAEFAHKLRKLEVKNLSVDDQRTALKYICSIIFFEAVTNTASSFLTLPRRISAFPRLKRLDHMIGWPNVFSARFIITQLEYRKEAYHGFIEALGCIGVPVDRLEIGIIHCEDRAGDPDTGYNDRVMRADVYPLLRFKGSLLAKQKARMH
ncbi:hypothetical protein VTN00DRAFT_6107 [Thermoascus crustaceus]|uniref:uncharacterized protein n=1 Tax=Thermoascus crustaceus TaxID=5088 RepID=UPI00374316B4